MELKLLSQLLGLPGFFVKDIIDKPKKIILTLERQGFPICPECEQVYLLTTKDSREQVIEDLSIFGKRCLLRFKKYRINCECGYKGTEHIDWCPRYQRFTNRYKNWIYEFCKRMTGIDVARIFGISKHTVYRLDKVGIKEELSRQNEISPKRISLDEISRKKGHRYCTIITAPFEKMILDVKKGRKSTDIKSFFESKGEKWCENINSVAMDAWPAYKKIVKKYCTKAKICYDHFHLAQHFSRAIDMLRVKEAKKSGNKKDFYKGTRWLLLKRPEKLNDNQKDIINKLFQINKRLYKAYILRDEFRQIFRGTTAHSRLIRLTNWIKRAKEVHISEITVFAKKIDKWKPYIANSLRYNTSNSFSEGINAKVRVIQRMAYGYKDFEYLRLKIIQQFNFRGIKSLFES